MLLETVLFFCLAFAAFLCYVWWYQNFSRFFILLNKIPAPPGLPIIGNIHEFIFSEDIFAIDRKRNQEYYPIFREWCLLDGAVNLSHPSDIELVISSNKHIDKSQIYNFLHAWLGTGLLTSGGAKWQNRRKILTPGFHFNILQEFIPIFNEETQKLVNEMKERGGGVIDVVPMISHFTLLSIAETSMGVKLDALPESCKLYKEAIHNFGYSIPQRVVRPWLYNDSIFYNLSSLGRITKKSIRVLHKFSRVLIARKASSSVPPKTKRMAMLDLLLAAKNQGADIDDEGIAEEVDTFMFEGHDTTAVAISYALLLLANHPQIQDEVYQEMKEVMGNLKQPPSFNDLKDLTFMERCLKETLRLYPSVPFISRVVSEDLPTASGYVIPKGCMAHVHIYDLHRNPEIYPEPDKFDPDRFLPENTKDRHPFAYLPFSAGPRNCIGQKFAMLELKAVLCGILGTFILEPVDTVADVAHMADLVLRCKGGIKVNFKLRK